MQKTVIAGLLLFGAPVLFATPQSTTASDVDKLIARELAASSAFDTLADLTDGIGARPSGSPNAAAAVQWALNRFRSWGIAAHAEKVTVPHWVRGIESARLISHHDQRIVLTALGMSVATPASGLTADVVEVHSFEELKNLGAAAVKGKIVFFNVPMDMSMVVAHHSFDAYRIAQPFRGDGASKAAQLGAVAVVIRSLGTASLRTPHTGSLHYDATAPRIPAAAMTTEDSELIHRLLAKGERVRMHIVLTPQTLPDVESANVVAEIKGTAFPEEIVLIGAHLDSWDLGTGAIDDGSGVAMVMETMRLLQELKLSPRRTIRAVLFMNEENGLRGGRAYAAEHKLELAKHVAAIESDSGAAAPTGFTTTLTGNALASLRAGTAALSRIGSAKFETVAKPGADTSFLVDAGVPGFGLVPEPLHYFDYHHTPADTLDKIDPQELAQDSAAIAALTWLLSENGLPRE
jgi:carboxypeptidase Q